MRGQKRQSVKRGFTLLELVIASLALGILSVGALGYQYHATRDARRAEVQATAARLAKTLLDNWKGVDGRLDYDPTSVFAGSLTLVSSTVGPVPGDNGGSAFALHGRYRVTINSDVYFVTCSYLDASAAGPRLLNVAVAWRPDYANGTLGEDAQEVRYSVFSRQ